MSSGAGREAVASRRRGRVLPLVAAALLALLLALVVSDLLLLRDVRRADRVERARLGAVAAALAAVPRIGSYGYETFEADRAAARPLLTATQAAEYDRLLESRKGQVDEQRAVVRSVVRQAQAIEADSDRQVRVLLFVDQTTTSAGLSAPSATPYAFVAVMQRQDDGRWLVGALNTADGAPTAGP